MLGNTVWEQLVNSFTNAGTSGWSALISWRHHRELRWTQLYGLPVSPCMNIMNTLKTKVYFSLEQSLTHTHTHRQTDRQTDGRTDRQTDIHTYIHMPIRMYSYIIDSMIEYPRQMALRGCLQISIQPLVLLQRKTRQVPPVSSVGHSPPAVPRRWVHFYILFVGTWGLQLVSVLRLHDVALGLGYTLKITKVTAFHSEAWNPWKIVDAAVFRSIAFIVGPKKTSSNMDISNPETSSSIPDISSSYPEVSPLLSSQSACVGMFRMFLVHLTGSLATGVALVSVEMVLQQQQQQQKKKKICRCLVFLQMPSYKRFLLMSALLSSPSLQADGRKWGMYHHLPIGLARVWPESYRHK